MSTQEAMISHPVWVMCRGSYLCDGTIAHLKQIPVSLAPTVPIFKQALYMLSTLCS